MIKGERLKLRMVKEQDLDKLISYLNDLAAKGDYENLVLIPEAILRRQYAETGYWTDDEGILNITSHEDELWGYIRYSKPFTSPFRLTYEIVYAIFDPENWGNGLMSEALQLYVPFLFDLKRVDRIQAMVHPDNVGSKRVLEKCNFRYEGTLRRLYKHRGQLSDVDIYSILRSEASPVRIG